MSSKWKVEKMMEEEKIYVSNNTNEAEECLANGDCTKLGQMLSNQGSRLIQVSFSSTPTTRVN